MEGVEAMAEAELSHIVLPEDKEETPVNLSPLQQLNLRMSPTNRGDASANMMISGDWRKRRIGHTHLEEDWRPQLGLLEPLPGDEEDSEAKEDNDRQKQGSDEDEELDRRSELEDEEVERWEKEQELRREEELQRNAKSSRGSQLRGLLSVDFGPRRAKSPVTVQVGEGLVVLVTCCYFFTATPTLKC